jgi:hypothetical protein
VEKEKTHYRKAFNSPYLSSADIVEPTILTIKKVQLLPDKTKKTKDQFNTAFFTEKEIRQGEELKPMILNATNSRTMKSLTGSAFIDDWNNIPVTVYVDQNVKMMGNTVEGLRISTEPPRLQKPVLLPNTPAWNNALVAHKKYGNLDKVKQRMTISKEDEINLIAEANKNVD